MSDLLLKVRFYKEWLIRCMCFIAPGLIVSIQYVSQFYKNQVQYF